MPIATSKSATSSPEQIEQQIATLLDKKAVSTGSKNYAQIFEKIARENGHIVTFAQAKAVFPNSPSDLAFHFRQAGGKIASTRGKAGTTIWTVVKLANGELGYPENVRKEVERLKMELANAKK
jgi:hypothetical protein